MRMTGMQWSRWMRVAAGVALGLAIAGVTVGRERVAAGPAESRYRVLPPIESGSLTLFPVVAAGAKTGNGEEFLTLDEGLMSGEVEVTEAGKVRGMVRPRGGVMPRMEQGDQVNTLVLVNHAKRPLLLLAGEIVTGGKQDRIIGKDRIVPVGADPIDLSVFCIEHGRWTESSAKFGAAASVSSARVPEGFMVQPAVRQQAMVAKDQQQVWDSVGGAITAMAGAAAPSPNTPARPLGTTSYAKAMQSEAVTAKVDERAASVGIAREQVLATLRQEHAVGVVVAVHGEIIWSDIFASTDLLTRYWTKLVRSYAAEALGGGGRQGGVGTAEAQRFLDKPAEGREESEGEVGVYRNREVNAGAMDILTLESLLPGAAYDVHISRVKLRGAMVLPVVRMR